MGLRILHSADWHLDAPFATVSRERRAYLRNRQRRIPGRIAEVCRSQDCDVVMLAGDLFDGIPTRETLEAVKQALEDCRVPVFVAPGNHDFCGAGSPWLEEAWPENVKVFTGNLESVVIPELGCRVYGAGYRSMDCSSLLEGFRIQGKERYHIGVFHGDPLNVGSAYNPVTVAQVRDSGLTYLALGHIHTAGNFSAGGTFCAWPGCPMGRGWDETGEKGILLADVEEETEAVFVPLDGIRFYDLEADVTDGAEAALAALLPGGESEDFFRVTLTGRTDEDVHQLEGSYTHLPNLVFRDRTVPREDLWAQADQDTFRGIYFRILRDLAPQEPAARLAAEISRNLLEGREVILP